MTPMEPLPAGKEHQGTLAGNHHDAMRLGHQPPCLQPFTPREWSKTVAYGVPYTRL